MVTCRVITLMHWQQKEIGIKSKAEDGDKVLSQLFLLLLLLLFDFWTVIGELLEHIWLRWKTRGR